MKGPTPGKGRPAPWYDRFFRQEYLAFDEHPDTDLEVEFLVRTLRLESAARILDVGCGYGRHILPLFRKGYAVVGIDRSPVMLTAARRAADDLLLVRADMRALPFHRQFDIALSLFTSFGYFDSEDDNFRVLKGIADSLVQGGRFLIETANRDFVVRHSVPVQVYRPAGMLLIEERQFDPVSGRSRVDVTVVRKGRQTHLFHSIRLYAYTELEMLLVAAGLVPLDIWGSFHGSDYTCDSSHMIVMAQKP